MKEYNGLAQVAWFVSGYFWGNCFNGLFGADIAWAIGGIAFLVLVIVLITIIVVESRRD